MDDQRFDALARAMAAGRNRRQIVRGLLGLGAGAVAAGAVTEAEAARRGFPGPRLPTPPPCVPQCDGTTCGSDGCGGTCACSAGSCVNGGCFGACDSDPIQTGSNLMARCDYFDDVNPCYCIPTAPDQERLLCLPQSGGNGSCTSNADCPSGSVCGEYSRLCTWPCAS